MLDEYSWSQKLLFNSDDENETNNDEQETIDDEDWEDDGPSDDFIIRKLPPDNINPDDDLDD